MTSCLDMVQGTPFHDLYMFVPLEGRILFSSPDPLAGDFEHLLRSLLHKLTHRTSSDGFRTIYT